MIHTYRFCLSYRAPICDNGVWVLLGGGHRSDPQQPGEKDGRGGAERRHATREGGGQQAHGETGGQQHHGLGSGASFKIVEIFHTF